MKPLSAYLPAIRRLGTVLALAGGVTYLGFLAIDLLMPLRMPAQTREDKLRLARTPLLHPQPKAPAFLELTDGAVPARIPNFNFIEPASTREHLLRLTAGTEVMVLRPAEVSTWLAPFDIVALRVNGAEILSAQATVAAHRERASSSRSVVLYIAFTGAALLGMSRFLQRAPHAA
jgi:hypothetical protein